MSSFPALMDIDGSRSMRSKTTMLRCDTVRCVLQYVAVLQCVAVSCGVLQCPPFRY